MGPSGCGKTTLIRCVNRMHELIPGAKVTGKMFLKDDDVYAMEPIVLRRKIGMVFQKPNPFPMMSIYDNVIAGYKTERYSTEKRRV
jgi:phosphate transport system ATP-binding protein